MRHSQQALKFPESLADMLYDPIDPNNYVQSTYIPIKHLGSGSFSHVLECMHVKTEQRVAIKVMNKLKVVGTQLSMLIQEADLLKVLKHKTMVNFYEKRDSTQKCYLIMELFDGVPLTQLIESRSLTNDQIQNIMRSLCEGLSYIHSQDVIHRDLKPGSLFHYFTQNLDNILVKEQDDGSFDVRIIDFGLSFQKKDTILITQQNCGTLIYSAPEVANNNQYNQKVDIWSLGIIFYVMFNKGIHPMWQSQDNKGTYMQKLQLFDEESITIPSGMNKLAQSFFVKTASRLAENRMSARQSLEHPWITGEGQEPRTMIDLIKEIETIQRFEQLIKAILFCSYLKDKSVFHKVKQYRQDLETIVEADSSSMTKQKIKLSLNLVPLVEVRQMECNTSNILVVGISPPPSFRSRAQIIGDYPQFKLSMKRTSMSNLNEKSTDNFHFNYKRKISSSSVLKDVSQVITQPNSPLKLNQYCSTPLISEAHYGDEDDFREPVNVSTTSRHKLLTRQKNQPKPRIQSDSPKKQGVILPQLTKPSIQPLIKALDKNRYYIPIKTIVQSRIKPTNQNYLS